MFENKNESYFRKLIKGQINLATTFWIWFVFVTLAINIFIDNNFSQIDYHRTTNDQTFSIIIYFFTFIYSIFIFISIHRSANNYLGNNSLILSVDTPASVNYDMGKGVYGSYDNILLIANNNDGWRHQPSNLPLKKNKYMVDVLVLRTSKLYIMHPAIFDFILFLQKSLCSGSIFFHFSFGF